MWSRIISYLGILISTGLLLTGCGLNPFGQGALGGLNIYAKFAKAMEKPKAIEEEEGGKEGSKQVIKEGVAATGRAKRAASGGMDPWIVEQGLIKSGDTLIYWEHVKDKPTEEDPDKKVTGRGEVAFGYGGASLPATLDQVDTTLITDLYYFHFTGREIKNENFVHAGQICSLDVTVQFSSSDINDIKPGKTWFWAKNISPTLELGQDDTASFILDELDDVNHIQYGEGHFLDANSGKDNDEGPRDFNFDLEVHHKNSLDPGKPYYRYQDNEGIVMFTLPWGKSEVDSLYFSIHFYPQYEREGAIHKNGPDGPVLVRFKHNEKTGDGWVTYYNEDGEEIGS